MIYFISTGAGHIKIGFSRTSEGVQKRLRSLQGGNIYTLSVVGEVSGTLQDERNLHHMFASLRLGGEWFRETPEILQVLSDSKRLHQVPDYVSSAPAWVRGGNGRRRSARGVQGPADIYIQQYLRRARAFAQLGTSCAL